MQSTGSTRRYAGSRSKVATPSRSPPRFSRSAKAGRTRRSDERARGHDRQPPRPACAGGGQVRAPGRGLQLARDGLSRRHPRRRKVDPRPVDARGVPGNEAPPHDPGGRRDRGGRPARRARPHPVWRGGIVPEVFRGVGVSPGVAVGRALPWQPEAAAEPRREPGAGATPSSELARFASARERARDELSRLKSRLMSTLGDSYAQILAAQTMLLDDPALIAEVEHRVHADGVSAAFAVHATVQTYLARFAAIEDRYLRDRAGDLRELQQRLVRLLEPAPETGAPQPEGPIVVVPPA